MGPHLPRRRPAPDPDLFFLNLSRWSIPSRRLPEAGVRPRGPAPSDRGASGGSEFIPEQIARRPEIFRFLFLEDGSFGDPSRVRWGGSPGGGDRCTTEEELNATCAG